MHSLRFTCGGGQFCSHFVDDGTAISVIGEWLRPETDHRKGRKVELVLAAVDPPLFILSLWWVEVVFVEV